MRIKEVLKRHGVSQKELADRLGINPVSVSRLLSDKNDLRVSTLLRIADAVGCEPCEFFEPHNGTPEEGPYVICPGCGAKIGLSAFVEEPGYGNCEVVVQGDDKSS